MPEKKDKKEQQSRNQFIKVILIWAAVFGGLYILLQYTQMEKPEEVSFTKFWQMVEEGKISQVIFSGMDITAKGNGEQPVLKTRLPFEDAELPKDLVKRGIEVKTENKMEILKLVGQFLLPIILMVFLLFFVRSYYHPKT